MITHVASSGETSADVMAQVTFTIPMRIDSRDRLRNLLTIVRHLHRTYPSRIVVGSDEPGGLQHLLPAGVEVLPIDSNVELPFHHTRVLNDLAWVVTTPVIINTETDIIIPEAQLREAVRQIIEGERDVILPYSGDQGIGIPPDEREAFLAGPLDASAAGDRQRWHWNVIGGCVVWNRAEFHRVGMENEHFIGWGLEDDERIHRAQALGARFGRVDGPLFHIDHERGLGSSDRTDYYVTNKAELRRIQSLDRAELESEVAAWPWTQGSTTVTVQPVAARDLTILIPVRLEHPDRRRNLLVCTRALDATLDTRVIVGLGNPAGLHRWLPEHNDVVAVHDPPGPFHRTRILNDLVRLADTEFVALLDTDVIIPQHQWQECLDRLRAGADLVLPYDGTFLDVPHSTHPWLQRGAYSSMPRVRFDVWHPNSVGGCVVWRRESFLNAGMENEHFVSWGGEDDERVARARTLGMDVQRCSGELYHLAHHRGPDSGDTNPQFAANMDEFRRISAMPADALRTEIETWPWRNR